MNWGDPLGRWGTPLDILSKRLRGLPGADQIILVASDRETEQPVITEAREKGLGVQLFSLEKIREKPLAHRQDRWQLGSKNGHDFWLGSVLAEAAGKFHFDEIIVIPLYNLLVDRQGVVESLQLHRREGFDATFSEDRLPGADWAILDGTLLAGLQKVHPDIMETRGGLHWAIRRPLYPFKVGGYHLPRQPAHPRIDARFQTRRMRDVFSRSGDPNFGNPEFSYVAWLERRDWQEHFTDAAPLHAVIEPTNTCLGRCFACPNPRLRRPRGNMEPGLFSRIHQGFRDSEDTRWVFSGMGEPLMHPSLPEMIERCSGHHSMLVTSLQTDIPIQVDWRHLDLIRVSLDSHERSGFEQCRPGCSWEKIHAFLTESALRKEKNPDLEPEVGVSFLKHHLNSAVSGDFLRYWRQLSQPPFKTDFFVWPRNDGTGKIQWFQILGCSDFLGQIPNESNIRYTPLNRRFCSHALTGFHVLWDGRVTICPYDIEGAWLLGNVREQEPMEIWHSEKARDFRRQHLEGHFSAEFPCLNCQDWYHLE